jgi:hypothetical protein
LRASNTSDAEKINAYAKKLNNVYKFELTGEDGYGGLEFFDLGFCYGTVGRSDAKKFDDFINKVVAHFPEMKLHLFVSGDGACQQWEKISKNGVLVDFEPWYMNIHCEDFKELLSNIGYIEQQGFKVLQDETACSLLWEYDLKSEDEKCYSTLQHISKLLPQAEIICYKNECKDNVPCISEYCTMRDGKGKWIEADSTIMNLGDECVGGVLEGKATIFDVIKDAGACFALALTNHTYASLFTNSFFNTGFKAFAAPTGSVLRFTSASFTIPIRALICLFCCFNSSFESSCPNANDAPRTIAKDNTNFFISISFNYYVLVIDCLCFL